MWTSWAVGFAGIWLMMSHWVLGYGNPARVSDLVTGPIVATLGFIAVAEATRPVVRAALAPGLWLLLAPWILGYEAAATWSNCITGLLLCVLALVAKAMDPAKFGGGWSVLWNGVLRRRLYGPDGT